MNWAIRRLIIVSCFFLIVAAAPSKAEASTTYCPFPGDACAACYWDMGGQCEGCAYSYCPTCCQEALCAVYDPETEQYTYYWTNYMWCYDCCNI